MTQIYDTRVTIIALVTLLQFVNGRREEDLGGKQSRYPLPSRLQSTTVAVALKVDNVKKVFDSRSASAKKMVVALDGVSFEVKRGEFVSIVGPSGSGKSTLLNVIGALDRPTSGKVFINGQDIFLLDDARLSDVRSRLIGFIFQSYNLINRMSIQENVEFPAVFSERPPTSSSSSSSSDSRKRALELLKILGIEDKVKQKPVDLSGGEQQRVAIARALINDPALVLADEPTGNLDTKTGREVFDLLKMLSDRFGTTVVMVTHNLGLAGMTTRSIYIRDGRIEKEILHKATSETEAASSPYDATKDIASQEKAR